MAFIEQGPVRRVGLVESTPLADLRVTRAISLPSDPASPNRMLANLLEARGLATINIVDGDDDAMYQLEASPETARLYQAIQERPDFLLLTAASDPLRTEPNQFKRLQELLEPLNPINPVMRTRVAALYWSNRLVALEETEATWNENLAARELLNGSTNRLRVLLNNAREKNKKIQRLAELSESGEHQLLSHDDEVLLLGRILDAALGARPTR